jgi:general secretion pathway protein D
MKTPVQQLDCPRTRQGLGGNVYQRPKLKGLPLAAGLVLAVAGAALGGPTMAAPHAHLSESASAAETYTFAFHDADISQIAQAILGDTLNVGYTVDPAITGKMSFRLEQRLTRPQLLEAFEAALAANDIVMVHEGSNLVLQPRAKAKTTAGLHTIGEGGLHRAGYEVVAVPLSFALPTEVAKALDAIAPSNTVIYSNDKLGLIILGGNGQELETTLQTLKVFDQNGLEESKIRWFELSRAPAVTVAGDLKSVLDAAGVSGVSIVPLKRLNGLFVFARASQALDEVAHWVEKLDVAGKDESTTLWVYHPRNASAEGLSRTLNNLLFGTANNAPSQGGTLNRTASTMTTSTTSIGGSPGGFQSAGAGGGGFLQQPQPQQQAPVVGPTTPGAPSSGGVAARSDEDGLRIGVDNDSNTLLISGSSSQWIQIQRILQDIDVAPRQILIEASVVEVTLTNDFQFGVDWSAMGNNLGASSINSSSGTVAASTPGLALTFLGPDVKVALNTLRSKTNVEVVSAPKIVTLDNQSAQLQVGDQVPIITQSAQSTSSAGAPLVSSVNYLSTGIILNVTPRISGEDKIVLTIDQEVSATEQTTTSGIDSPTIQQRSFNSTVVVPSGEVVALGGLISTNKSTTRSGIPWLSDVPGVGALFRTDTKTNDRTELIVLISAKIIQSPASLDRVMTDLMADMKEIKSRGLVKTR